MADPALTPDDVYAYMDDIPPELVDCAAAKHAWKPHNWHGWNANGREVKNPRNAVALDVTERCKPCGLKRHCTITVSHGRPADRTDYTYSDRNPRITSPEGVSGTGVSVRREMGLTGIYSKIIAAPIALRPAGSKGNSRKGSRGAA